jgi:hypothetical protein
MRLFTAAKIETGSMDCLDRRSWRCDWLPKKDALSIGEKHCPP